MAREPAHDVIVLDVMLPGLDSYQVCRRLREQGVWTPILMLTAMDEDLDHAEGLDSGADDYLTKPFSYPVLLAHLRSLTRRGLPERPAVLSVAGLTLDPASRTVMRGGQPIGLTNREVAVLEYLMRRQGRVVSRTELLEHCWDPAYDGDRPSSRFSSTGCADASHELRTPLAAIRMTLDVGLAYPDQAPWPVIAERAARQSARLEELIRQLLLLAKADGGSRARALGEVGEWTNERSWR